MKYMEENYREKISLEQIAANMYLSSFYIAKIFKSETGDTPINYLIGLRMEKAKEILEAYPEEPVKEVVAAVGYSMHIILASCLKALWNFSSIL